MPNLETEVEGSLENVFNEDSEDSEDSEENSAIEIDCTDENTNTESVESGREPNDSVHVSKTEFTSTTIEVVSKEVDTSIIHARKVRIPNNKYKTETARDICWKQRYHPNVTV